MELKETEFLKELKANLLIKTEAADPFTDRSARAAHPPVTDKRIKVLVAGTSSFRKLEKAVRLLQTYVPDIRIFGAGNDIADLPALCSGFLLTDPGEGIFAAKVLEEKEGIRIDASEGAVLAAAITLAKKEDYTGNNILVWLAENK